MDLFYFPFSRLVLGIINNTFRILIFGFKPSEGGRGEQLTLVVKNIQSQISINDMHVNKNGNCVFQQLVAVTLLKLFNLNMHYDILETCIYTR